MRAASVGIDGVLRDSDGNPVHRGRPLQRPQQPQIYSRAAVPVRRTGSPMSNVAMMADMATPKIPPNCPIPSGLAPEVAKNVGPARCVANQVGVSTRGFSFSKVIGDPERSVYPSRIVYQATDDDVSLYAVSFRTPESQDSVKLLKLEGTGKGRWFEVPLSRKTDANGKLLPGLMTDFMVVPHTMTGMIWYYVDSVPPIFEGTTESDYNRVSPTGLGAAFELARQGFEVMSGDAGTITADNIIQNVVQAAMAALTTGMYALDSVAAGYDVSRLGLHAYRNYLKIGTDIVKAAMTVIDLSFEVLRDPSMLSKNVPAIMSIRNDILRRERLHAQYLFRSTAYTIWDSAVNLGTIQDINSNAYHVFRGLLQLIAQKTPELLAGGVSQSDLDLINTFIGTYVSDYPTRMNEIWDSAYEVFGAQGAVPQDVYDLVYSIPVLLKQNTEDIRKELEGLRYPAPARPTVGLIYLSGMGASAIPEKTLREIMKSFESRLDYLNKNRHIPDVEKQYKAFMDSAIKLIREGVNDATLRRLGDRAQILIDLNQARSINEKLKQARTLDAQAEQISLEISSLTRKINSEKDENIKKNLEGQRLQLEKNLESVRKDAKLLRTGVSTEDEVTLSMFFEFTKARDELGPNPSHQQMLEAEFKVYSSMAYTPEFIRTLPVSAQESIAQLVYLSKDNPVAIKAGQWYDLIVTGAQKVDPKMTPTQMAKHADIVIKNVIKDLDVEHNPDRVLRFAHRFLDPNYKPTNAELERDFPEATLEVKDTSGKITKPSMGGGGIRTALEKAAASINFKDVLLRGEAEKKTTELQAEAERAIMEIEAGRSWVMPESAWDAQRERNINIADFLKAPKDGKSMAQTLVDSLTSADEKANPYSGVLSKTAEGQRLQKALKDDLSAVQAEADAVGKFFGNTYQDYKDRTESKDPEKLVSQTKQSELLRKSKNLNAIYDRLRENIISARMEARKYETTKAFFKKGWEIFLNLHSLDTGPAGRLLDKLKGLSSPVQIVIAITSALPILLAQTFLLLGEAALIGIPGGLLTKSMLETLIGSTIGWTGGDPTLRQNSPSEKSSSLLPFFGFALAIALISSGRNVFDAVGKTVGGFFQFATAVLPGKGKGGGKGGGGGGGGGGARRGAPIIVSDWLERLENAKNRFEKAEAAGDKRGMASAQRDIDRAIQKLKKAKEEGEDVPEFEGLWGFDWLG